MENTCTKCGDEHPQTDLVCTKCDAITVYDTNELTDNGDGTFISETPSGTRVLITCSCGGAFFRKEYEKLCPGCSHMLEKEINS